MKKFTPPAKKAAAPAPAPTKKVAKHTGPQIPTAGQKGGAGYFGA